MDADRHRLDELLRQVSDGLPVDWETVRRELPADERDQAEALHEVAQIADFSRLLQRSDRPEDAIGETSTLESWGGLLLLQQIGSGSMADVYRAWDLELRREVALKLLRQDPGAGTPIQKSPLMAEARAAAAVRHPNVVVVHGIAEHKGRVGLWMELVRGESLEALVRRRGALPLDEVRRLGAEIGSAVEAMHAVDLLHRDIKPANVVRDEHGRWVLTDFGLGSRPDPRATELSWATGTPMYMAPELLAGAPHSPRTELYALGMLLWFALAGRHPFEVTSLAALRDAARTGPRPALAELRPDAPEALVRAIQQAIAPEPEDRSVGVHEFVTALGRDDAVAAPTVAVEAATTAKPPRRRSLVLVPLLIALAIAITSVTRRDGGTLPEDPAAAQIFDIDAALVRHGEAGVQPLVDGDRVAPGDRLSLQVRVSRPVWVYVLNEDEAGERYLLFPQPMFDQVNPVAADSVLLLPGSMGGVRSAWTVTSAGGREHFLIVVSPEPVEELQAELDRLPAPRAGQPVEYAQVGEEAVHRLRGVGGVTSIPRPRFPEDTASLGFDKFRALAGRETGVRGTWVRHVVLENSRH